MSSDERPQSGLSGIARDLADDVLAKEDALLVTESSIQDVITASQEMENLPGGLQEEEVPPQEEADSLMASTVVDQTASVVLEHVSSDLAQQALSANEADGAGTTAVAEEAGGGATEEAPAVGEAKPDDAAAETTAVADAVAEAKPDDAVQTKPEEDELAGGPSEERPGSKRSASSSVDYGAQSFTSDTDLAEEAVVEDAVAAVVEDIPLVGESSTSQMLNTSVEEKEPEEIGEQSSEPLVQRRIQAESGTGTRSNSRVSQQDDVADMPAPSIHVQFLEVADPVNYDPVDEATTTAHVEAVMAAASSPTGGGVRFTFNDNEAEQNAGNGRAEEVLQGEAEGTSTEQQAVGTTTTEINATESPQETPIAEPPLVTGSDDISSTRRPTTPPKEPSMTMSVGPPESSIMGGESLAATTSTEMPPFPRFSTQHLKKVLKWTQGPEEYVQNILDVSPEQGTIYLVLVKWLIQPLPTHWRFRQGYDHFREKGEVRTLDNIDQEDLLFYNVATGECSRLHPQHDLMQLVVEVSKQENVRGVSMARSALKEWLVGQIHQWTGPFYDSKGAYWTKDNAFTRVDPRVAAQRGYQRAVRCIKLLCSHAGVNPSVILEDDEKPTPRRDFYKIEVEYQNLLSEGNKSREAQSRALQQELGVLAPDTPPKVRQKTPPPIIKPPAAKLKARERTKNVMAFFHGADTYLEVYSETNAFMRDHLEFIRAKTTAKGKSQLEAISAINKAKTCTEWFSSNVKTAGMLSQSRKLLPYDPNAVYLNRPMVSKTRTRGNGGATTLNPLGNGGTDTMRSNSLSLGAERGGKPGLSAFPEFLGDSQDTTDSKFGPLGDHNKVDNASPGEGEPMSLDNYAFVRPQGRERPPQSGPLDLGPSQLEDDPEFENAKIENRYILSENFEPVCENMLEPPVRKPRPLRDNERHAVDWSPQTRKAFEDNKASYEQYLEENAPKDVLTQAAEKDAAEKEAVDNAKNKKKAAADARRQKRGSRSPVVVPAEPSISGEVPAPSIGGQTESGASSGSGGGVESSTKLEEEDGDGNALVEAAGEDVGEDVENAANNGAAPTLALALEEVFTGEAADDDLSPVAAALVDRAVAESVPPSRGENEKPREGSSSEESATSSVSGAVVKDVIRGGLEESLGAEVERVRRTEQEKAAKNDEHTLSELLVFDAVRSGVEQVYGNDVESAHGESKTVSKAGTKESSSGGPGRPFGTEPEVAADGAAASGDAPLTSQGDRVVDTTEVLMRGDDAPKVQEDAFADVEAGDAQHKAEDEGEGAEGEMKALEEPQEEKVDEEDGEFEDEQDEDDEEEDAEPSEQEQLSSEGAEGGAGDLQPSDVTPTLCLIQFSLSHI
ncbi:unnamed protein product [Amoebophrya sp. A25]|nr:unnamed protein product [Amoebophrya sp. A25]|eukprot:GSA25T00025725001.1